MLYKKIHILIFAFYENNNREVNINKFKIINEIKNSFTKFTINILTIK